MNDKDQNPCKDCITLAICVAMVRNMTSSSDMLQKEFLKRCPYVRQYFKIEYGIPPSTRTKKYYSEMEYIKDPHDLMKKIDEIFKYLKNPFIYDNDE